MTLETAHRGAATAAEPRSTPLPPLQGGSALPAIPLGELLKQYQLGLVLVAGTTPPANTPPVSTHTGETHPLHAPHTDTHPANTTDVAAREVQWVHVSELEDPTPFLTPRTVLLTTGARFAKLRTQRDADAYVQRLVDVGTTALGVSIGLHWDRIPARFVTACDRYGLPLIRVPYTTSFITVVQTAARLLDALVRERDLWSLEAQRAVTAAALQRNGLEAVIRETAAQLGRWVGIADRSGKFIELAPKSARTTAPSEWIRHEIRELLTRGVSAARVDAARIAPVRPERHTGFHMQTLGRPAHTLGVLVVAGSDSSDTAERALLGLVSALATLQLEQRSGVEAAHTKLRAAILRLIFSQQLALAQQLSEDALLRMPREPVVLMRYTTQTDTHPDFFTDLRSFDAGHPGIIHTELDGHPLILCEKRHLTPLKSIFQQHRIAAGISAQGTLSNAAALRNEADTALRYATQHTPPAPVHYRAALHDGLWSILTAQKDAQRRAATLLAPLRQHDQKHSDNLEHSLRSWLAHHGQTSPAAAELSIHRHTLKARITTAAQLLQCDLESADTRAELWAALRLTAHPQDLIPAPGSTGVGERNNTLGPISGTDPTPAVHTAHHP